LIWAAFLQQSIPAIPGMLHSCSLECSGMPANTLPAITRISASDAKRIIMPWPIYVTIPNFVKEYCESVLVHFSNFDLLFRPGFRDCVKTPAVILPKLQLGVTRRLSEAINR
jgi:hypothetical protein